MNDTEEREKLLDNTVELINNYVNEVVAQELNSLAQQLKTVNITKEHLKEYIRVGSLEGVAENIVQQCSNKIGDASTDKMILRLAIQAPFENDRVTVLMSKSKEGTREYVDQEQLSERGHAEYLLSRCTADKLVMLSGDTYQESVNVVEEVLEELQKHLTSKQKVLH